MENVAATPLNVLTAASGHTPRTSSDAKDDDAGSFEEALGSEMAAITPNAKTAGVDLLAAATTPAASDSAVPADGTQVLQAILDAATVLPAIGVPVSPAALEKLKAAKELDPGLSHLAPVKDARPASPLPTGELGAEATLEQTDEASQRKVPGASNGATIAATIAAEEAARVNVAAAAVLPAAAIPLASGNHPVAPEAITPAQKNPTTSVKAPLAPQLPVTSSETRETRDSRDAAPARPLEELLTRIESKDERAHTDPLVAPSIEKLASSDVAPSANNVTSSLDALSSAALVSKWTSGQPNNVQAAHGNASARIDTPMGADGWGDAFSQKVVWLVDRQQQSAELHVNPPHLGPVEVVLKLSDDGARIAFCSPHAAVREAIEASLSDLRNALADRGLSLGQTLVSADPGTAREQLRDENVQNAQRTSADVTDRTAVTEVQSARPVRRGLVDIFA